jgi:hypothetical protein
MWLANIESQSTVYFSAGSVKLGNKQPLPEFNPDIKGGTSTEGV